MNKELVKNYQEKEQNQFFQNYEMKKKFLRDQEVRLQILQIALLLSGINHPKLWSLLTSSEKQKLWQK